MATRSQRNAYARRLREISRSFDWLERETLQQSIRLLRDVRDRLAGQLVDTDFAQFRLARQQQAIDDIIANYEAQARAMTNGAIRRSYVLGEQFAVEPLQAAGIQAAFFRPSESQVEVLAQFSADLISDLSQKLRGQVNSTIRLNALGGRSTIDAMKDITDILFKSKRPPSPRTRQPVKGVAYEAERILRNETNRAYNLATKAQQDRLVQDIPELGKQWLATADNRTRISHLLANGQIVAVDEPFIVGGEELMYPLDPAGSAKETILCRCRSVSIVPELVDTALINQADIDAELERRGVKAEPGASAVESPKRDTTKKALKWYEREGPKGELVDEDYPDWREFTGEQRSSAKDELISSLAERTGYSYDRVDATIHQWAVTSNDSEYASLHIQQMASEEFGIPLSQWQIDKIDVTIQSYVRFGDDPSAAKILPDADMRKLLREMHNITQEQLKDSGVETVRLYRGIDADIGEIGSTVTLESNAMESWSMNEIVANSFGNTVIVADVPIADIIGTARTGFGCLDEYEFVIKGGSRSVQIIQGILQ